MSPHSILKYFYCKFLIGPGRLNMYNQLRPTESTFLQRVLALRFEYSLCQKSKENVAWSLYNSNNNNFRLKLKKLDIELCFQLTARSLQFAILFCFFEVWRRTWVQLQIWIEWIDLLGYILKLCTVKKIGLKMQK